MATQSCLPAPILLGNITDRSSRNRAKRVGSVYSFLSAMALKRPARIFLSYCHEDETLRKTLDAHLRALRSVTVVWHDRRILPGEDWQARIDEEIKAADIIRLLVSASFIASDYCYGIELATALSRHHAGEAKVVPIILRPVVWRTTPFAHIQALPKDG